MRTIFQSLLILLISATIFSASCSKEPYELPYEHFGGWVIGKETCDTNPDEDYWLVDLSYQPGSKYGDTATVAGTLYTHVVKTKELPVNFKVVGKKVAFDFYLSNTTIQSSGCTVANPITYKLKVMDVINSGEWR